MEERGGRSTFEGVTMVLDKRERGGKGREGEELTPSPSTIDVSTSLSICAAIWHPSLC